MNSYAERKREAERIGRRGKEIYDNTIRHLVEPDHNGEFLVVDVTTGGYYLAETDIEALDEAEAANPSGRFHMIRVGHRTAYRVSSLCAISSL